MPEPATIQARQAQPVRCRAERSWAELARAPEGNVVRRERSLPSFVPAKVTLAQVANSSSNHFASFRSRVSNPSVNQP
jgi:hypothetical protein